MLQNEFQFLILKIDFYSFPFIYNSIIYHFYECVKSYPKTGLVCSPIIGFYGFLQSLILQSTLTIPKLSKSHPKVLNSKLSPFPKCFH